MANYEIANDYRHEVMGDEQVVSWALQTYRSCVMWDGNDAVAIESPEAVRGVLASNYVVEIHQSAAPARAMARPLCRVKRDQPWSEWAARL